MPAPTFDSLPEFRRILTRLRAATKPIGPIEEFIVRQLAAAHLKSNQFERIALALLDYQISDVAQSVDRELPDDPSPSTREAALLGYAFYCDSEHSNAQAKLMHIESAIDRSFHRNLLRLNLVQRARREANPK